ncbi:MAG TPA: hypothetical protein VLJ59_12530 [Mycobacteriales bacterium]|nr:hypothetical protein [Mycobacteriales bacterium]
MTDDGLQIIGRPLNGQYHPPDGCPPSAPGLTPCSGQSRDRKQYPVQQLTNAEAAALHRALTEAEAELLAFRVPVEQAAAELLRQEGRVTTVLHALDSFVAARRLGNAHERQATVRDEHRKDGAEDRRHRPRWVRVCLIPTVLAAAAYDTAFFSRVFLKFVNAAASPRNPIFYFSLIPGVVLATALLAAGHLVARAALRGRYHTERRPERIRFRARLRAFFTRKPPVPETRSSQEDLPWPQWWPAVAFATLVLATLGIWAVNRARNAPPGVSLDTPPGAVALLLLLLSLSAIAVTVIHHNPFADRAATVGHELDLAERSRDELVADSTEAITQYAMAAHDAQRLLDEIVGRAQAHLDHAWIGILHERDTHGRAGEVAPRFVSQPDASSRTTFIGIEEPRPRLTVLNATRDVLRRCDVADARARHKAALLALRGQVRAASHAGPPDDGAPAN